MATAPLDEEGTGLALFGSGVAWCRLTKDDDVACGCVSSLSISPSLGIISITVALIGSASLATAPGSVSMAFAWLTRAIHANVRNNVTCI